MSTRAEMVYNRYYDEAFIRDGLGKEAAMRAGIAAAYEAGLHDGSTANVHHLWFPIRDIPITLSLSREQLQCVQDALLGRKEPVLGWNEHFAGELEKVLRDSIDVPDALVQGEKK